MDKVKFLATNLFKKDGLYTNIASVIITVLIVKILGFIKEVYVGNIFGMSEELDIFFIFVSLAQTSSTRCKALIVKYLIPSITISLFSFAFGKCSFILVYFFTSSIG